MPPNISIIVPGNVGQLRITVAGAVHTIHPTLRIVESSQMRNDDAAFDLIALLVNLLQGFIADIFQQK